MQWEDHMSPTPDGPIEVRMPFARCLDHLPAQVRGICPDIAMQCSDGAGNTSFQLSWFVGSQRVMIMATPQLTAQLILLPKSNDHRA